MENSAPIDRISNLPDELLSHILSFLPTKLAFTTTVLSKRWTPLFKLLTTLRFDDESVHNHESFIHICSFIDTVMLSTQFVKTIHLNFRSIHTNRFNFKHWIETVKRQLVENLHILSLCIPLPPSIFKFPTLVVLTLKFVDVTGNISADLPSLKILHLNDVDFKFKRDFNNLLYGCPILEDLVAQISYIKRRTEGVTVRAREFKSLSNLITADINAFDVPLRTISNVKILKLKMTKRLLEINSNHGGFPVFQNLINLNISINKFHHWDDLVGVIQYCPKLQILCIFKLAVTKHLSINWRYPNSVPECISSHLRSCSINYEGWEDELRFTKYILQNAHFLEVMKINISHSLNPNLHPLEELSSVPMISPQCKLSIG